MSEDIIYKADLPKGWEILNFKETCFNISLNKIKVKQKQYKQKGKYPIIDQGQDLIGGYFDNDELVVDGIPPFIIFGDHTKVKKYVNFKFIAGADGIKVLKPYDFLIPKLFFYFLHCIQLPDKGYARHYQFLNKAEFPLPPLPEQHRIVAKIEELFSSLDKGIESLKTAQEQLKIYRQAVLKWAFEGKLTNEEVKEGELPEGWVVKISSKIIDIRDGTHDTPKYVKNKGIPLITSKNLKNGKIDFKKVSLISKDDYIEISKRSGVEKGDVLFAMIGTIGNPVVVKGNEIFSIKNVGLFKKNEREIVPEYLCNFLGSQVFKHQIEERELLKGTTQKFIPLGNLRNIHIPLPSISEQHHIVSEIESRLSVCDKIEESIATSLQQAELLRQSILKKAFEGKLVAQDPNDEPASVLLERIMAEREENKPVKKTKVKKEKSKKS